VNFYEHHLGDYDGATAHLSWLEDCAYRRMLCLYYRTEAPLPADVKQVCRLVRATSKPERDAVQQVLTEFFELAGDGWHNGRCDEDISAYHDLEPEREAKRENAKERQRRARARRAELFEVLRGHNIVPPFDTATKALEALLSRVTGALPVTAPVTPVTRDDTATHTHLPLPTSHSPVPKPVVKDIPPSAGAAAPPSASPPSPEDRIFALGVPLLTAAGVAERNARSMLGMLRKRHGDEAVADAIDRCAALQVSEPVSWLQAALKPKPEAKTAQPGARRDIFAGLER